MKFTIIVKSPLVNSYSALNFTIAAIKLNQAIPVIFFYQHGTNIANAFIDLPQDEINIQQKWQALAQNHGVQLVVCSASALRQGLQLDKLATHFVVGSLGQLTEVIGAAERVVVF